ncbi:hypothetical protein [Serratia sp. Se-RSBMAAmG]|uniref:hypothetical protein n=1 Tax=Serratia sp. Se-RSBMAAmG TaxID=3043305 RepID=UPI0024AEC0F9|nr:hypothetical protein [Serratia sp. Se-RSBMAAmG]MDI6976052.1 hypothetical protein [Serratia sp. Se-RSBMAAmG]
MNVFPMVVKIECTSDELYCGDVAKRVVEHYKSYNAFSEEDIQEELVDMYEEEREYDYNVDAKSLQLSMHMGFDNESNGLSLQLVVLK